MSADQESKADYAAGISGLRDKADRNWVKVESDLARLRELFTEADERLEHVQATHAHITGTATAPPERTNPSGYPWGARQ